MAKTPKNQMGLAGQILWLTDQDYLGTPAGTPPGWQVLSQTSTTTITNAATNYPTLYGRYTSTDTRSPIYRSGNNLVVQKMFFSKETKWVNIQPSCTVNAGAITYIWAKFLADTYGWRIRLMISAGDFAQLYIGGSGNLAVTFAPSFGGGQGQQGAFSNVSAGGYNGVGTYNGSNALGCSGNVAPNGTAEYHLASEPNWSLFSASGFTSYAQIADKPNQTAFLRLYD
jgi:hypothetical protein